jgi:hypothetical protein
MRSIRSIVAASGAVLFAVACGSASPTSPSATGGTAVSSTRVASADARSGGSCIVDVGTTEHPLRAVHELEAYLNVAIAASGLDVNCGLVRSLDAKLEALAAALDETPPAYHPACGVSGALANEIEALARRGTLTLPTFPPPFPGGPTDVLAAAQDLSGRWCAAARGELEGPRS